MNDVARTKQRIYKGLDSLTPDALTKIAEVVDSLQTHHTNAPLALGGMWKDIPFDITNRDVRALRRKISRNVLRRKI